MFRRRALLGAALVAALAPLLAQERRGTPMVPDPLTAFRASTPGASVDVVAAEGPGFTRALRVRVDRAGRAWDAEVRATIGRPVVAGQACVLRVWVRNADATRAPRAVLTMYAQSAAPPWDKAMEVDVAVGTAWTEVVMPWRWQASQATSGAMVGFGLGRWPQVVELGGIEVRALPDDEPARLPRSSFTYDGRDPRAPWRARAEAGIERWRTAPMTVRVLDARDGPVAGAEVRVEMTRHAFAFGTAVAEERLLGQTSDDESYRSRLLATFNAATPENALKWPAWEGEWGVAYERARTLDVLRWLDAREFHVRGHVLVWPGWTHLPARVRRLRADAGAPATVVPMVRNHIAALTRATAPLVDEWDVVNEPFEHRDLMDLAGWSQVGQWFTTAAVGAPGATLALNDTDVLGAHGADLERQAFDHALLDRLRAERAPLSTVGLQAHMGAAPTSIPRVLAVLDEFARHGLPIRITEFDVDTDDEALQADYTRDFLTAVFGHPAVSGVTFWGFWEGAHWRPRAALYRRDWSEKPAGAAFRALVHDRWWTRTSGRTDDAGRVTLRGVFGDYRIVARHGGTMQETRVRHTRDHPATATLTLPR